MKKVLLVANWDWVLFNFRFALAKTLKREGYDVVLVCPEGSYIERMKSEGFRWVDWSLQRRSLNPVNELKSISTLANIYREEAPDLIHHDTIKPNFYGSMAVRLNRWRASNALNPRVINTFMGLGYLFSNHPKATLLRRSLLPVIRFALDQPGLFTIFSNQRDRQTFISQNLLSEDKTQVLVSECVNISAFRPSLDEASTTDRPLRVLMAARLLWDKGVQEFVDASRILQARGHKVEFLLAGLPDKENPQWVPEENLRAWESEGLIQWLGHRSDMPELLQQVDISILPTHYNEGLPRFLVESASAGLPLIATDIPACKRIVRDDINGIIIPTQDPASLAGAVERLLLSKSLRQEMSAASRKIAVEEFDENQILRQWQGMYDKLVNDEEVPVPQAS